MNTILTARILHVQLRNVFTRINSIFPMRSADFLFHISQRQTKENLHKREKFHFVSGAVEKHFTFRRSDRMWFSHRCNICLQFLSLFLLKFLVGFTSFFHRKSLLFVNAKVVKMHIQNEERRKYLTSD